MRLSRTAMPGSPCPAGSGVTRDQELASGWKHATCRGREVSGSLNPHSKCVSCSWYLQDVSPIPVLVVASTDHINASVNGGHAMPRPPHRPLSARRPAIGRRVKTVSLFEVHGSSAATCDVHLPIKHCSGVGVHLEGRSDECERAAPSCGRRLYYTSPLSSGATRTPRCCCAGRSAPPRPARCCSPAPRWRKCGRPARTRSGRRAAAAEAGWHTSGYDEGRTCREEETKEFSHRDDPLFPECFITDELFCVQDFNVSPSLKRIIYFCPLNPREAGTKE